MGFFKDVLRKASGQPTESEVNRALNNLRERIFMLQAFALSLDEANDSDDDISLFVFLRMDLLSFSLHIASSDNMLDANEVKAINAFLGMDMSYSECKSMIEDLGLGSALFNRTLPASFQILTEMAKYAEADAIKFAEGLIATYEQLGIVIAKVDGDFDAREQRDLDNYINMLKRYARTL